METYLPKSPFNNLALSLSGGGYRAAAFHLGLMTYLSSVKWEGKSLLDRVRIISTVSGGTFTGVCYAATVARKGTIEDCLKKMYGFFTDVDVIDKGLKKLEDFDHWKPNKSRSLINALSLVYFDEFEQGTFKTLFDNDSHLKEIIFNATEFTYGLPFRFQKTSVNNPAPISAFYGNKQVNMSAEALKEVRLADVVAASSCFPGGFEPINFPDDFKHLESPLLDTLKVSYLKDSWGRRCHFPIGLMDGGIVDNQGIDSVFNAEKRMRNYGDDLKEFTSDDVKAIDLYIISDVSSPYMDSYIRTRENKIEGWRSLSFRKFSIIGIGLLIAAVALVTAAILSSRQSVVFAGGFFSSLLFVAGVICLFLSNIFNRIIRKFEVPKYFINKMKFFSRLKFGIYETLIKNRVTSVISMVSEVFMKQIRRREYDRVYHEDEWRPRLIMNAIYELSSKKMKGTGEEGKSFDSMYMSPPGEELIKTADRADSMSTTLWFTAQELKDLPKKRSMVDALMACGQFTGCYNLLEYIEKTFWSQENSEAYQKYPPETRLKIKELYEQLLSDWEDFNVNPYRMTDEMNGTA